MTTNAEVTLAEIQLREARERAASSERAATIEKLRTTRAEIRTLRERFIKLKQEIDAGDAALASWRRKVDYVLGEISRSMSLRPAVADVLPDDSEVQQWKQQHEALLTAHAAMLLERTALPNVELLRIDQVNLRDRILRIEYAEQNLLNLLNGTLPALARGPHGGIFGV